jgi:HK97 gp10 family phage protein
MSLDGTKWLNNFKKKLNKAVENVADIGLEVLKESVSEPYPPPSAPETPPHLRSGNLRDGLTVTVDGIDIEFDSSASYSADVEFGTSRMQPRPFLRPHKQWAKMNFLNLLAEELEKL